jgi:hypothetical protein
LHRREFSRRTLVGRGRMSAAAGMHAVPSGHQLGAGDRLAFLRPCSGANCPSQRVHGARRPAPSQARGGPRARVRRGGLIASRLHLPPVGGVALGPFSITDVNSTEEATLRGVVQVPQPGRRFMHYL